MDNSHPPGKKQKKGRQVDSFLSTDTPAIPMEPQEIESDNGDYGEEKWDPHAGTKPSPLDGDALDEERDSSSEVKGFESEAFNDQMVKMVSDLQDDNLRDQEWKQKRRQKIKSGQFRITH